MSLPRRTYQRFPFALTAFVAAVALVLFAQAASALESAPSPEQVERVLQQAQGAAVRVLPHASKFSVGMGWIVSKEGHVVVTVHGNITRDPEPIPLALPNGERAVARVLGWSGEFRIALLQLESEMAWPHVELGTHDNGRRDEPCVGVGYSQSTGQLSAFPGSINRDYGPVWGTASYDDWEFGNGVFDAQGRLIGITTNYAAHFFRSLKRERGKLAPVHTRANVIRDHWEDLLDGSLDERRLDARKLDRQQPVEIEPRKRTKIAGDVFERAKSASIWLRRQGADRNWGSSGVVISKDGLIVSCGHHFLLPGDKIFVTFANGQEAPGVILGTNWVTDISVAKIMEDGPWPYVPIGDSQALNPADSCWTIGYPAIRGSGGKFEPRRLAVQQTSIVSIGDGSLSVQIRSKGLRASGESGGGLFDQHGRLVGIGESLTATDTDHVRIEALLAQWEYLTKSQVRP